MAAGTISRMRLENINTNTPNLIYDEYVSKLKHKFTKIYLLSIDYEATFPNGYAEMSPPNAVFDGTATPAVVYIDSTDAKDTSDGVGVREVTIIGIGETGLLQVEAVATGGTSATVTTNKWQRLFHAYASKWGSENDAAGTITVQDAATATATYLTIGAAANDSDGAAFWVPTGYYTKMKTCTLTMTTSANANAALLFKETYVNFDTDGQDPNLNDFQLRASISGNSVRTGMGRFRKANAVATSKVTPSITYKGAAEDGRVRVEFYILGA